MNTPHLAPLLGLPEALQRARQLLRDGDPRHAEVVIRAAQTHHGEHAELWAALAQVQQSQGLFEAALQSCRRTWALQVDGPWAASSHAEAAQCLRSLGRAEEATVQFQRACEAEPGNGRWSLLLMLHQGNLLDEQGRVAEALQVFEAATQQHPESADAWAMQGVAQSYLRQLEQAERSFGQVLQLDGGRLDIVERLAINLMDQSRLEDAALVFQHLLQKDPGRPFAVGHLLHLKYLMCDWLKLPELQHRVEQGLAAGRPAAEPFGALGWCADPALLARAAGDHAARHHPPQPGLLAPALIGRGSRIRLGYVAGELRGHAVGMLLAGALEHHDRDRFEVFAFDTHQSDGSELRRRIEAVCQFHSVKSLGNLQAAQLIREKGIDVLVNLNGYSGAQRTGIFALRPAAVQVNYLGYPGTMGAPYIDYIVADATVIPEAESGHYQEQVVHLPHCYQPNDNTRPIAQRPASRSEAGLPETGFVFCCLNNTYKIVPSVFNVWMRLLHQVPGSVLLLYGDKPELQANLHHEAKQRGVDPQRVLFAGPWPNDHHLRRLQWCDLFLDTLPYNAHTTGSDALWAGLPMLTCSGRTFPSRVGASLLHAVGLPELVTDSLAQYEALALRLATEPALLAGLRQRLQQQLPTAPLYDTRRYTRHLEAAYLHMVQRARDGLPPAAFAVPEQPVAIIR